MTGSGDASTGSRGGVGVSVDLEVRGPGERRGGGPDANAGRVLVIDDERGIRALCSDVLSRAGCAVAVAETGEDGLARAEHEAFDLVLCDINLPGVDGLGVLSRLLARPDPPAVLLITAYPSVDTAVRGMKLGARDYLTKPFTPDELRMVCRRALDEDAMRRENATLRRELAYGNLIGESPAMRQLKVTIARVADSDITVLVTGESGTGKELVARALHYQGRRAGQPFVPVNCGALVGSLLESELFGHEKGAFTGADSKKRGLFAAARGGTLFLDEIGELPLPLQPKLLRALADGEIKPVGGLQPVRVDVRVIAATNRDLGVAVREGTFREDLYYRLNAMKIDVPALRDRALDIPLLCEHFATLAAQRARRARPDLTEAALAYLAAQPWPGNVRELENAIERAVVLATGPALHEQDFAPIASRVSDARTDNPSDRAAEPSSLAELERRHILHVLDVCEGQKTKAAAILGINRTTLWKKLRQYGLE